MRHRWFQVFNKQLNTDATDSEPWFVDINGTLYYETTDIENPLVPADPDIYVLEEYQRIKEDEIWITRYNVDKLFTKEELEQLADKLEIKHLETLNFLISGGQCKQIYHKY